MKQIVSCLIALSFCHGAALAQPEWGVEIYHYIKSKPAWQPIAFLQTADNWYAEIRYNYEDEKTFSLYGGRSFSTGSRLRVDGSSLIGFSTGSFTGVSVAGNLHLEWNKFEFSSLSQYSIDTRRTDSLAGKLRSGNFFFTWSEACITLSEKLQAGLAAQFTGEHGASRWSPGLSFQVRLGQIHFPVYAFDLLRRDRYYVVGLCYEWTKK